MRFKFQTAIARQTYQKSCAAVDVAEGAETTSSNNKIRLDSLVTWFKWLTGGTAFGGMFLVVLAVLDII